jgi:FkbM family methyltransferase
MACQSAWVLSFMLVKLARAFIGFLRLVGATRRSNPASGKFFSRHFNLARQEEFWLPGFAMDISLKDGLRTVRRRVRSWLGQDVFIAADFDCAHARFGSGYGGWDVATIGLDADAVVYAFGVGEDISFDLALIERFGMTVHAFDPTPQSIAWVKRQNPPELFELHEYGLAGFDGEVTFNPPADPAHVSHTMLARPETGARAITVPVKRLTTIMRALGHDHVVVLKMDIEGAEYAVIDDLAVAAVRPLQVLVEFHHRFPEIGVGRTREAVGRLSGMGYRLFSVSATGEEFCFLYDRSFQAV